MASQQTDASVCDAKVAYAHPSLLLSDAGEPVVRPALGVRHGQDAHLIFPDEKDERVREAGDQGPAGSQGSRPRLEAEKRSEGAFR